MTPAQYLAACKVKLGHVSNYELAKRWQISDGYMSYLSRGLRPINAHIAILIAITLELDPLRVLADIESQQQTGKVQEFWTGFLSRVSQLAVFLGLVTLGLFVPTENVQETAGGSTDGHRIIYIMSTNGMLMLL